MFGADVVCYELPAQLPLDEVGHLGCAGCAFDILVVGGVQRCGRLESCDFRFRIAAVVTLRRDVRVVAYRGCRFLSLRPGHD